uniref:Uncharacterized protein n=1 Tax=Nicotiana tabacum TaxID=4097 RepID=A0A1S3YYX9_TOBAC|nr:PREDICTED: uncharacterized protein LOC107781235 [Nicotiana tabacum]
MKVSSPGIYFNEEYIVLIDETRGGVNTRFEVWRQTLGSKGFNLSKTKTEYLECKFIDVTHEADVEVRLDTQTDYNVWSGALASQELSCPELQVAEMRMLRWMCEHTKRDNIRNEDIRDKVGMTPVVDKLWEARLRWFGHVKRRCPDAPSEKV